MYVITNRRITNSKNLSAFTKKISEKGPNEIRIMDVNKSGGGWSVSAVPDVLKLPQVRKLKREFDLNIDENEDWHGSLQVACSLYSQAIKQKRSILFFIHGYNNDIKDVIRTSFALEEQYGVIVVPISWPADGGGVLSGTASYLSDKSDARASIEAVNRIVGKIHYYHQILVESANEKYFSFASEKHKDNQTKVAALYVDSVRENCCVRLNLMCHSMGAYLIEKMISIEDHALNCAVFDNICFIAPDNNNKNHKKWIDQIDTRNRLYVVINENDETLMFSRIKPGEEQRSRLGNYLRRLTSEVAMYVDVTNEEGVDRRHGYYLGGSVKSNSALNHFFKHVFNGESADSLLEYQMRNNTYRLK